MNTEHMSGTSEFQVGSEADQSTTGSQNTVEFRVTCPGAPVRRLRLSGNRYTFGSAAGCSVQLNDPSIRPMHAVLIRDAYRVLVRAYSVPVEVNGNRTTETTLHIGDVMKMGAYRLELLTAPERRSRSPLSPAPLDETRNLLLEAEQLRERQVELLQTELRDKESDIQRRASLLEQRESHLMSQETAIDEIRQEYESKQREVEHLREREESFEKELREREESYENRLAEIQRQQDTKQQELQELVQREHELAELLRYRESEFEARQEELDNRLRSREEEFAKRESEFQSQLESRESELQARERELREQLESRETELREQLESRETELRDQERDYEERLASRQSELTEKEQEFENQLRSRDEELAVRESELRGQLESLESDLRRQLETQESELRGQLTAREEELREQEESARSEIESLRESNQARQEELQEELESLRSQRTELESEVEQNNQRYQTLESEYKRLVEDAKQQADTASEAIQRLRDQVASINEQLESAEIKRMAAETDRLQAESERNEARKSLRRVETERDDAVRQGEAAEARNRELADSMAKNNDQSTEDREFVAQLQAEIDRLQSRVTEADAEASQLRSDYEKACASVRQLELLVDQTTNKGQADRESWERESVELREMVDNLTFELAQAKSEMADLRANNSELAEQLEAANLERASRDESTREQAEALEALRAELANATCRLDDMQREHESTVAELVAQREVDREEASRQIEQALESQRQELESRILANAQIEQDHSQEIESGVDAEQQPSFEQAIDSDVNDRDAEANSEESDEEAPAPESAQNLVERVDTDLVNELRRDLDEILASRAPQVDSQRDYRIEGSESRNPDHLEPQESEDWTEANSEQGPESAIHEDAEWTEEAPEDAVGSTIRDIEESVEEVISELREVEQQWTSNDVDSEDSAQQESVAVSNEESGVASATSEPDAGISEPDVSGADDFDADAHVDELYQQLIGDDASDSDEGETQYYRSDAEQIAEFADQWDQHAEGASQVASDQSEPGDSVEPIADSPTDERSELRDLTEFAESEAESARAAESIVSSDIDDVEESVGDGWSSSAESGEDSQDSWSQESTPAAAEQDAWAPEAENQEQDHSEVEPSSSDALQVDEVESSAENAWDSHVPSDVEVARGGGEASFDSASETDERIEADAQDEWSSHTQQVENADAGQEHLEEQGSSSQWASEESESDAGDAWDSHTQQMLDIPHQQEESAANEDSAAQAWDSEHNHASATGDVADDASEEPNESWANSEASASQQLDYEHTQPFHTGEASESGSESPESNPDFGAMAEMSGHRSGHDDDASYGAQATAHFADSGFTPPEPMDAEFSGSGTLDSESSISDTGSLAEMLIRDLEEVDSDGQVDQTFAMDSLSPTVDDATEDSQSSGWNYESSNYQFDSEAEELASGSHDGEADFATQHHGYEGTEELGQDPGAEGSYDQEHYQDQQSTADYQSQLSHQDDGDYQEADDSYGLSYSEPTGIGSGSEPQPPEDVEATTSDFQQQVDTPAAGEDDDSIEAYMNRLLQRVQGSGDDEAGHTTSVQTEKVNFTPDPPPTERMPEGEAGQLRNAHLAEQPVDDGPLIPRSEAPEKNSDLSAMRELANQTARNAVARSVRVQARNTQMKAGVKVIYGVICILCAVVSYFMMHSSLLVKGGIILPLLVFAGFFFKEGYDQATEARKRVKKADDSSDDDEEAAADA